MTCNDTAPKTCEYHGCGKPAVEFIGDMQTCADPEHVAWMCQALEDREFDTEL